MKQNPESNYFEGLEGVSPDQLVDRVTRISRFVRARHSFAFSLGFGDFHRAELTNTAMTRVNPRRVQGGALDSAIAQPAMASTVIGSAQYRLSVNILPASNYTKQAPVYQRYELQRSVELRGTDAIGRLVTGVAFQRMGDSSTLQKHHIGIVNDTEVAEFAQGSGDAELLDSLAKDAATKERFDLMALNNPEHVGTLVTDEAIYGMIDGETTASPQIMNELDGLLSSWSVIAGMRLDMSRTHLM